MSSETITQQVRWEQREMGKPKEQQQNSPAQAAAIPKHHYLLSSLPKGFLKVYLILSSGFPHPGFSPPFMAYTSPSPQGSLFRYNPFSSNEISSFQERIKTAQMTLLAKKEEIERGKREAKVWHLN